MVREHRRAVLSLAAWAFGSMTVFSLSFGLAYLPHLSLRDLPRWAAVTVSYAALLGGGILLGHGLVWLVFRAFGRTTLGLVGRIVACCIGADLGYFPSELTKAALIHQKAELSPYSVSIVSAWWLGMVFLGVKLAFEYAGRYRRIKQATELVQGQVLANQLKPHFLFNAMNSLTELIETDPRQGAEMAHRLSELFRHISRSAEHATMPLDTELGIVREYLEIEKVRLGPRLVFTLEQPAWPKETHVPTLMVQTLVENAIKHGIAPSIEGGELHVSFVVRSDGIRECIVFNTGNRYAPTPECAGIGISNSRERLRQLYGANGVLKIDAGEDGTRATFSFTGDVLAQNLGH